MKKIGQFEMSFSMIFSIILIIAFLSVAIYVIYKFINIQERITTKQFILNLQEYVDGFWQGTNSYGEQILPGLSVPRNTEMICFADLTKPARVNIDLYDEFKQYEYLEPNLFFYPFGSAQGEETGKIEHLNLNETVKTENPYCINSKNGKINLIIGRKYGESLVTIKENVE